MRALNKAGGPTREAYSSYGFLRVEPFQPKLKPGHRGAKPFKDELDGELYIRAIDYFMTKVRQAPRHGTPQASGRD